MFATSDKPESTRRAILLLPLAAGALYVFGQSDDLPDLNIKEVLLEEARALIATGALVLDVRERAAYEAKHLPGALLAPLDALPKLVLGSLAYAKTMPILVYCGDGSSLGPRGTHALNSAGFAQAVNLKPGVQGWAAAGLPIEQGAGKHA